MDIKARNLSLDVFRGITICFMIIVNTPGNGDCVFGPSITPGGMGSLQPIWCFLPFCSQWAMQSILV